MNLMVMTSSISPSSDNDLELALLSNKVEFFKIASIPHQLIAAPSSAELNLKVELSTIELS